MASRRDRGDGVTVPFQGGSAMPRRSLETRLHAGSPGQSHGGRRAARAAGPSSSVVPDWWRPECLDTATPDRNAPLAYDAIQHGEVTASRCPGGRGTRGAPGGWPARAQALPSSAWIRGQGAVWAGRETFARTPHQLPRLDAMRSAFQGLRRSTGAQMSHARLITARPVALRRFALGIGYFAPSRASTAGLRCPRDSMAIRNS